MAPLQRSAPPGVFIVLFGLVRVEVERGGRQESRFLGVGSSFGLLPSIIGRDLPGAGLVAAYGQGNAMGRGAMVLHLPMRLLATIKQRAAVAVEAAARNNLPISSLLPGAAVADSTPLGELMVVVCVCVCLCVVICWVGGCWHAFIIAHPQDSVV